MLPERIAILHYSSPPVVGGVEFIIDAHSRLFAEAGHSTKLIVGTGEPAHRGVEVDVIPELASDGGPLASMVQELLAGRIPDGLEKAVERLSRRIGKALADVDVCIIHNVLTMHFNLVLTAALARLMDQPGDCRFIGWTHDAAFVDPVYAEHHRDAYPWSLLRTMLPGCDYCVISNQRRQELQRLFDVPAALLPVIPDGIDVRSLMGLSARMRRLFVGERLYRKDLVLLTPTRIVRRKNLERGLEVVASLKRLGKQVRWFVTGAPDPHNGDAVAYFAELLEARKRLRLERHVVFLCERFKSRISNDDLRGLYNLSSVLLFPSDREGFGIPVLEAGLMGLLVVISDIPALREIGGVETVYIYPDEGAEDVACRIVRAFDRCSQLTFRRQVISSYSWGALFDRRILPAITKPESIWRAKGTV